MPAVVYILTRVQKMESKKCNIKRQFLNEYTHVLVDCFQSYNFWIGRNMFTIDSWKTVSLLKMGPWPDSTPLSKLKF